MALDTYPFCVHIICTPGIDGPPVELSVALACSCLLPVQLELVLKAPRVVAFIEYFKELYPCAGALVEFCPLSSLHVLGKKQPVAGAVCDPSMAGIALLFPVRTLAPGVTYSAVPPASEETTPLQAARITAEEEALLHAHGCLTCAHARQQAAQGLLPVELCKKYNDPSYVFHAATGEGGGVEVDYPADMPICPSGVSRPAPSVLPPLPEVASEHPRAAEAPVFMLDLGGGLEVTPAGLASVEGHDDEALLVWMMDPASKKLRGIADEVVRGLHALKGENKHIGRIGHSPEYRLDALMRQGDHAYPLVVKWNDVQAPTESQGEIDLGFLPPWVLALALQPKSSIDVNLPGHVLVRTGVHPRLRAIRYTLPGRAVELQIGMVFDHAHQSGVIVMMGLLLRAETVSFFATPETLSVPSLGHWEISEDVVTRKATACFQPLLVRTGPYVARVEERTGLVCYYRRCAPVSGGLLAEGEKPQLMIESAMAPSRAILEEAIPFIPLVL